MIENATGNDGYDGVGISQKEAEDLLKEEKYLFDEARKMNIDYTKLSESSKSPKADQNRPPKLDYLPLDGNNGYMYAQ